MSNYAGAITAEPYQTYPGPRVAPFDPAQQQAFQYGSDNALNWQPIAQQAGQSLTAGAQPFSQAGLQQFMNPYQSNVTDRIATLGNRNFSENILPDLNSAFVGSGQFGSSRNMDLAGRAARDSQESILGQQGLALSQGFQNSMTNYGNWQDRAITGGGALSQFAGNQQGLDTRTTAGLDAIGQEQQGQAQKSYDTAYSDFVAQRDKPIQNLQIMQGALQGMQLPQTGSTTSTGPASAYSPSPLSQIAGLYSLYNGVQSRAPTPQPLLQRRGGRIRFARGGPIRFPGAMGPSMMRGMRPGVPMARGMGMVPGASPLRAMRNQFPGAMAPGPSMGAY